MNEAELNNPRTTRKGYPSDVRDAEREFCQPYLELMLEDAPQRVYSPSLSSKL